MQRNRIAARLRVRSARLRVCAALNFHETPKPKVNDNLRLFKIPYGMLKVDERE